MGALEDLWNGSLCPAENDLSLEAHDAMISITKETKKLTEKLSPEQSKMLGKISNLRVKHMEIVKRDSFAAGFRLAMKLMMDSLNHHES